MLVLICSYIASVVLFGSYITFGAKKNLDEYPAFISWRRHCFSGGWGVRAVVHQWRLACFSSTSLTGGGHDQLIRESIPPPFSPGFWDGVGSPLNVGPCAHKRPERK